MKRPPGTTFDERFAYAQWVRELWAPAESDAAFAQRAGVSTGWVSKWKRRQDTPPGTRELELTSLALDCTEEWLRGSGEPPPEIFDQQPMGRAKPSDKKRRA